MAFPRRKTCARHSSFYLWQIQFVIKKAELPNGVIFVTRVVNIGHWVQKL
jgi:hypothetical protein